MSDITINAENAQHFHIHGDNLAVYSNKDRVSQMKASMNYGLDEKGKNIFDHIGLPTPTEFKILQYIQKYINHNTNMFSMCAKTFDLPTSNYARALSRFKKANFIRKIGKDDLPDCIVKKNTYMVNPYMLIPQYGSRAHTADVWNQIRGHPTDFVGANKETV